MRGGRRLSMDTGSMAIGWRKSEHRAVEVQLGLEAADRCSPPCGSRAARPRRRRTPPAGPCARAASAIISAWFGGTTLSSSPWNRMSAARQPIGEVDRRARAIERLRLGIRADQRVEVARLELVRVLRQHLEVADAVVAGAGAEDVVEGQRRQRRVAAGAAAADRPVASRIGLAASRPGTARR